MGIGTKLLLVEDDKFIALALKVRLQSLGFNVYVVGGCEAAFESAVQIRPDIAVVDYNLPDGNGLELMKRFSEEFQQYPIASIMMTASKQPGLCEQALNHGALDYIEKPFKSADLIKSIENIRTATASKAAD